MSDLSDEEIERIASGIEDGDPETLCQQACDALRAFMEERRKLRNLDSEAASHVESVIVMRSRRFTGEPPYVGWKGLGKALSEDYDELARLKAKAEGDMDV